MEKNDNLEYWKLQQPPEPGKLFTDPLFPPNMNSLLGLDTNGQPIDLVAYNEKSVEREEFKDITFARPNEIFGENYKLFSGKIEIDDVKQGGLGDCYFLSTVANLCKVPGIIANLFKTKEMNKDGFYEIILMIDGKPQIVIVDDFIPVRMSDSNKPKCCFAKPHEKEIWVLLLEKAWAKINGGYLNIITGRPREAFEVLTGFGSTTYDLLDINSSNQELIKKEAANAYETNAFLSCSTIDEERIQKKGLIDSHVYSLLSVNKINLPSSMNVTLFRLRNPWSHQEWNGDWSEESYKWCDYSRKQVDFKKQDDGIFFMCDKDFFYYFKRIEICYVLYDSTSLMYTIEEKNHKDGSVFNLEVMKMDSYQY